MTRFSRYPLSLAAAGWLVAASGAQVQQSPVREQVAIQPQIEIAGTGVGTLDIGRLGAFGGRGLGSRSQINFSDSGLLLGAAQRLYRNAIGSFTIGGLTIDSSNRGFGAPQLFLHQAFLDFQELRFEGYVGRTNSPTAQLVTFPTIREDDFVDFTSVLNPFSNGANAEEHRYGNVAAVVLNQGLRSFENFHVQKLIDSAGIDQGQTAVNSAGFSYQFLGNPAIAPLQRYVNYGAGLEFRAVPATAGGASTVAYAGGVFNIRPSVTNRIDLRALAQVSFGNDTRILATPNDSYRADQQAIGVSLRQLYSPFGKPGYQIALTAGYKRYSRIPGAETYGAALSYIKSLGQGFDFVSQLSYQRRSGAFAAAFGGERDQTLLQVGLAFSFANTFNQTIGPRRSPTNLLHRYIPN